MRTWVAGAAAMVFWACGAAGQVPAGPTARPTDAEVLSSSELHYSESGGIAGRVHEATLTATAGRVSVSYRPGSSGAAGAALSGTLPAPRYLELWRESERIGAWSLPSVPPPTGGADMMQHELGLRLGTRSYRVSWVEGSETMREASAFGRRILEAAREVAMNQ